MKVKVNEATLIQLNWMVAKCLGTEHLFAGHEVGRLHYTTNWAQGGPIIERETIALFIGMEPERKENERWGAFSYRVGSDKTQYGPTLLIAAMRCYVASSLGDEVEIPDELI
jgi:hypothetical protein